MSGFINNNDILNLNASFDSIGGKVDIDWMMRSSLPIPIVGELGYYIGKPTWNGINIIASLKERLFAKCGWK